MIKVNNKHIVADPEICHDKPTFKGTRIMVWQIIEMLTSGMYESKILKEFSFLKPIYIKTILGISTNLHGRDKYAVFSRSTHILC